MKASDAIAHYLAAHDVTECYEMIGGMTTHIIDSLCQSNKFNITSVHHEQAAAFAAEGIARKTAGRKIGVAVATSGPGATNLITGIGSCWFDSVPCLFITGQVNVSELKGQSLIRQQGFQELDIVCLVQSITKYAYRVMRAEDLLPQLHKALTDAGSGRPGPVLLDIPNNIQREDIPTELVREWVNKPIERTQLSIIDSEALNKFKKLCSEAKRPLFLLGGGAKWADNIGRLLAELIDASVPYVSTLMGQEQITWSETYCGMIGSYGHRAANYAVQECDLLVVMGARLDVRQTGSNVVDFAKNAKLVQIDIDHAQIGNRVRCDLALNISLNHFLNSVSFNQESFRVQDPVWLPVLQRHLKETFVDEYPDWQISPFRAFAEIVKVFQGREVDYVCDVGNHQMWAAQCLTIGLRQSIHHSGGMGAMGFALPTAIGISSVTSGKTIVLTGDGSLQVNLQELDTLARIGSDVLILVFKNRSLGMVKNFQDMYFNGRNNSTKFGYSSPSFAKLAASFGLASYSVQSEAALFSALQESRDVKHPVLIELIMEYATECRPRLNFGNNIDNQHPVFKNFVPHSFE